MPCKKALKKDFTKQKVIYFVKPYHLKPSLSTMSIMDCQLLHQKLVSENLRNEDIKTGTYFQRNDTSKIIHFGILIHLFSRTQQKHQCLCFHYRD